MSLSPRKLLDQWHGLPWPCVEIRYRPLISARHLLPLDSDPPPISIKSFPATVVFWDIRITVQYTTVSTTATHASSAQLQ